MMNYKAQLCYIANEVAYFTTQPLNEQWGDDWDSIPYEYNAGVPYEDYGHDIYKIAFNTYGSANVPCSDHSNSPFSVKNINAGAIAWLRHDKGNLQAGATVSEFIEFINMIGGEYYLSSDWIRSLFLGFVWVLDNLLENGLYQELSTNHIEEIPSNWLIYDLIDEFLSNPIAQNETQSKHTIQQFFTTSHLCIDCNALCCKMPERIAITEYDKRPPNSMTEWINGILYMKKVDEHCIALGKDNKCIIYHTRPLACKLFKEDGERCTKLRAENTSPSSSVG